MQPFFQEHDRTYAKGKYPFTDSATLTSSTGAVLGHGIIKSMSVALLGLDTGIGGTVWLSALDTASRICELSCDTGVFARGTWDQSGTCRMYAVGVPDRRLGTILFDIEKLPGSIVSTFGPDATEFVPGLVTPIYGTGIRSMRSDDGGSITGDVVLKGAGGVFFGVLYGMGGDSGLLLISALSGWEGSGAFDPNSCDDRESVRRLEFTGHGSILQQPSDATPQSNTVILDADLYCANKKPRDVPGSKDKDILCDPEEDPGVPGGGAGPGEEDVHYTVMPRNSMINILPARMSAINVVQSGPHSLSISLQGRRHNTDGT